MNQYDDDGDDVTDTDKFQKNIRAVIRKLIAQKKIWVEKSGSQKSPIIHVDSSVDGNLLNEMRLARQICEDLKSYIINRESFCKVVGGKNQMRQLLKEIPEKKEPPVERNVQYDMEERQQPSLSR